MSWVCCTLSMTLWVAACGDAGQGDGSEVADATDAATSTSTDSTTDSTTGATESTESTESTGPSTDSTDSTDSATDSTDSTDSSTGDGDAIPEVRQDATYAVEMSTHVYGEGWRHDGWGGAQVDTIELRLDVYEPTDAPPGRPAMLLIHGGGFVGGTRADDNMVTFAEYFAARGWVTMSIDYRLAGDHGSLPTAWADAVASVVPQNQQMQGYALYPAARDAKAAARWLAANADTYQIDLDYLTSLGGSAGSYLAIMLGVTEPEDFRDEIDAMQDSTLAGTNLDASFEIHTIIDHWGGISHMELLEYIDGTSRFDATDAPVSIVHGTADPTVPFSQAEALRDAYVVTGVPYDFHPLAGAGHGVWNAMVDGLTLPELAFAFVVEQQGLVVLP